LFNHTADPRPDLTALEAANRSLGTIADPLYCVRVTANDGAGGGRHLELIQQNSKTVPTMLTRSQKLSTGVDAKIARNIVLIRQINPMIEFKQNIRRGARTFEGKDYFNIYDFVRAHLKFGDPDDSILDPLRDKLLNQRSAWNVPKPVLPRSMSNATPNLRRS
jgi:type I restriction enzyme, R subunit